MPFSMNIDVPALRDEINDRPGLSDTQRAALLALPDETLGAALEAVSYTWENTYYTMLDTMRGDAIDRLLSDTSPTAP